jgi:hypothetical protein
MNTATRWGILFFLLSSLFAVPREGIQPRKSAADFPQQKAGDGIVVAAASLTPEQVKSNFATDLNRGFLVVEVAIYPEKGRSIELHPSDFVLRSRTRELLGRPGDPKSIAASLQKAASSDRDVTLYPTATIGYESGPGYYDPMSGRRRGGGLYTGAGVGVGVGKSGAGATDQDRRTMELELTEKELPAGIAAAPVSGYLYFPLKSNKRRGDFFLEFTAGTESLMMQLLPDKPAH